LKTLKQIPEERRVYVDETEYEATLFREYGYNLRGKTVSGERTGKRFARTSLIAGLRQGKTLAAMEFKGYCDSNVIWMLVKEMLIPSLKPSDTVIGDNVTFHKSAKIAQAFEQANIGLLFCPPTAMISTLLSSFGHGLKCGFGR
jgi:isftu1 transposase